MSNADSGVVSVRYLIDDVDAAVTFYTKHFGFTVDVDYAPTCFGLAWQSPATAQWRKNLRKESNA